MRLGLACVSAGVGVSTIWYNIKKIKNLDKWRIQKQQFSAY
jgi:hypothetical protein